MRESFVFYASFLESLENLPADNQLRIFQAISKFALYDEDITEELSPIEKAIFVLIKPQINASNKRYETSKECAKYGKLGGRPKKEKTLKGFENKTPQEKNKTLNDNVNANVNENVNVNANANVNVEGEGERITPTPTPSQLPNSDFYGEYCNVYLNKTDKAKATAICFASGVMLPDVIEELSSAVETGRYPVYDEKRPSAHLAILKKFIDRKRLNLTTRPPNETDQQMIERLMKSHGLTDTG